MAGEEPNDEVVDSGLGFATLFQANCYFIDNLNRVRISWVVIQGVNVVFVFNLVLLQTFLQVTAICLRGLQVPICRLPLSRFDLFKHLVELGYAKVNGQCLVLDKRSDFLLLVHS